MVGGSCVAEREVVEDSLAHGLPKYWRPETSEDAPEAVTIVLALKTSRNDEVRRRWGGNNSSQRGVQSSLTTPSIIGLSTAGCNPTWALVGAAPLGLIQEERPLLLSPSYDWIGTLGQLNTIDLPLFETLYISGRMPLPGDPHGYDAAQNLSALTQGDGILRVPSLCSLGMSSYGLDLSHFALHWENLTNLAILGEQSAQPMSGLGRMLPLCRNLVTCTLHLRFRFLEESPEES